MTELLVFTPDLSYTALTSGHLAPVDLFLPLHVHSTVSGKHYYDSADCTQFIHIYLVVNYNAFQGFLLYSDI